MFMSRKNGQHFLNPKNASLFSKTCLVAGRNQAII